MAKTPGQLEDKWERLAKLARSKSGTYLAMMSFGSPGGDQIVLTFRNADRPWWWFYRTIEIPPGSGVSDVLSLIGSCIESTIRDLERGTESRERTE